MHLKTYVTQDAHKEKIQSATMVLNRPLRGFTDFTASSAAAGGTLKCKDQIFAPETEYKNKMI